MPQSHPLGWESWSDQNFCWQQCLNSIYMLASRIAHRPGQWNELIKYNQKAKISLTYYQASQRMHPAQFVRLPTHGILQVGLPGGRGAGKGCPQLVCFKLHSTQSNSCFHRKRLLTVHSRGSAGLRPPWTHPWCLLLKIFTSSLAFFPFTFFISGGAKEVCCEFTNAHLSPQLTPPRIHSLAQTGMLSG